MPFARFLKNIYIWHKTHTVHGHIRKQAAGDEKVSVRFDHCDTTKNPSKETHTQTQTLYFILYFQIFKRMPRHTELPIAIEHLCFFFVLLFSWIFLFEFFLLLLTWLRRFYTRTQHFFYYSMHLKGYLCKLFYAYMLLFYPFFSSYFIVVIVLLSTNFDYYIYICTRR